MNGETAIDCTIRHFSLRGTQIQLPKAMKLDKEIYLVDTRHEVAQLATVAWIKGDRAGLSFVRSYELASDLPAQLQFLERILFDAKQRQVHALQQRGVPLEEAIRTVGFSEKLLDRLDECQEVDKARPGLLHHATRLWRKSR